VIVFLFLGMTISSEEIIKDRKIIQRESFLNLSRGSYLHAKILIMFAVSAFQSLSYVLIGNLIFEIKGMLLPYWLILFTTSCFANLLGLNISSGLNSVIAIYILVPFLLIPQIIFSGVLVKYDKLHKSLTNYEYVPLIGNLMTSRWAYEALAVDQFKKNAYAKYYFDVEQKHSRAEYLQTYLVSDLQIKLNELEQDKLDDANAETTREHLNTLNAQLVQTGTLVPEIPPYDPLKYEGQPLDSATAYMQNYLNQITGLTRSILGTTTREKNAINTALIEKLGMKNYTSFRDSYENKSLSDLVLSKNVLGEKVLEKDGRLIRKYEPAYMNPTSRWGRAQLYAPVKQIGIFQIDTLWFNVIFIWLYSLLLYFALRTDLLRKIITFFETRKLSRGSST